MPPLSLTTLAFAAVLWSGLLPPSHPASVPRPRFSWDTLPVFFHSANQTGGAWNAAAVARVARFPLVASGVTGTRLPNGTRISMEISAPELCRQINAASNGSTHTFSYLHSFIDLPNKFDLHAELVSHPEWRLKRDNGSDWRWPGDNNWIFNLSNPDMRARWISECVSDVSAGCTGCFVDECNAAQPWVGTSPAAQQWLRAHLSSIVELNQRLTEMGRYAVNNHLGNTGDDVHAMMIEDFAGSEKCIKMLQTVSGRGMVVEAHAGLEPANHSCVNGGTNSLVAFLVGAGEYSYYHCQGPPWTWTTEPAWPSVHADSLDWYFRVWSGMTRRCAPSHHPTPNRLPEYEYSLGAPLGDATTRPSTTGNGSVWSRSFASGTRVEFDGGNGNGTVWWADGPVQVGGPTTSIVLSKFLRVEGTDPSQRAVCLTTHTPQTGKGCKWETD